MTPKMHNQFKMTKVDVLLSKGVKALAINLVDPAAAPTIIGKAKPDNIPVVFFNQKILVQKLSVAMSTLTMLVPTRKNQA